MSSIQTVALTHAQNTFFLRQNFAAGKCWNKTKLIQYAPFARAANEGKQCSRSSMKESNAKPVSRSMPRVKRHAKWSLASIFNCSRDNVDTDAPIEIISKFIESLPNALYKIQSIPIWIWNQLSFSSIFSKAQISLHIV